MPYLKKNTFNQKNSKEELLETIRSNFEFASSYYSEQREEALDDFRFRFGDQWEPHIRKQREEDGRPCLESNMIAQLVRQVVNNQKINRPSINVGATSADGELNTAKVLQAIIKNIEKMSNADAAYDRAFDCAATGGSGYLRLIPKYTNKLSFEQDLFIEPVDDPFTVYLDPNQKSDFSNLKWAFIFEKMPKEEFMELYPDSECVRTDWAGMNSIDWLSEDEVMIAEYFYLKSTTETIVLLNNDMKMTEAKFNLLENKDDYEIVKSRKRQKTEVHWVKTNGFEVLEETIFPGEHIPVFPVYGDNYKFNGKNVTCGLVRHAKSAQKQMNIWDSAQAELIGLAPKAPWIGAEGQFEGHEEKWNAANRVNLGYLEYKNILSNGSLIPPPARTQFDPAISTITQAKAMAQEDLRAITGVFDPTLGKEHILPESGVALVTRQRQAEVTSFMFIDNLSKTLKHMGRVLLTIIPTFYNTERRIRITGKLNQPDEIIEINKAIGEDSVFLEVGEYDVDVQIGPWGETKRSEATNIMFKIIEAIPNAAPLLADLILKNQEFEGAKEISERLKVFLPPELRGNGELSEEAQVVVQQKEADIQNLSQQLQQAQVLLSNTTAEMNKISAKLENENAKLENQWRIAELQEKTKVAIALMKEDSTDSRKLLEYEIGDRDRVAIPQQKDRYVMPGVNDPLTMANQEQQQEPVEEIDIDPAEELDLLRKLNGENNE